MNDMYSLFLAEKIDRVRMHVFENNIEYLLLDVLKHYIEHGGREIGYMLTSSERYQVKYQPIDELIEIIDAYMIFCRHGLFLKEEIVKILKKFYKSTLEKI